MDVAWGWWKATPNFQLGGGYWYNTGSLQAGVDWQHNIDLSGGRAGFTNTSNEQIRLTWMRAKTSQEARRATFAIGIEDNDASCSNRSFRS